MNLHEVSPLLNLFIFYELFLAQQNSCTEKLFGGGSSVTTGQYLKTEYLKKIMFRERMLKSKKKKVSPTLSPSYKVTNKRPRNRAANGALFQTGLLIFIIFFGLLFFICILNGFHPPEPSSAVFNRVSNNYGKSSHSHGYTEKRASDQTIFIAMPSTNDPGIHSHTYTPKYFVFH